MTRLQTYLNVLSGYHRTLRLGGAFALLMLILALVACGGESSEPAATAAPPAEATTVPAVESEPTTVPTAIPATAVPTESKPTSEPEPTTAPEPTLPPAPETSGGSCDNPYFPVFDDRVLRYRNTIPGMETTEYTMTYSEVTDSSFIATITFPDGDSIVQEWTCLDGGLLSPQLIQLPGGIEGIAVEYRDLEGLTLPPADQMRPGGSWTTRFTAAATMPDTGAGSMTMNQATEMTNTVAGIEAITVPAGTYPNAVRVETTATIDMTMAVGDQTGPANTIEMSFTSWYVEGIGLVRQEMTNLFEDGASVTELIAIE